MMRKNNQLYRIFLAITLLCLFSVAKAETPKSGHLKQQTGIASYFNDRYHGKRTASGEPYNKFDLTAAHANLPFGSIIRVVNLRNNQSVDVRINSRAHPANKRLLDLSKQAAIELGFLNAGTTEVAITVLQVGEV